MPEELRKILDEIDKIERDFHHALENARTKDGFEEIRLGYLSRKGKVQSLFSVLAQIPVADRPKVGERLNVLRTALQTAFDAKSSLLTVHKKESGFFDPTLPERFLRQGSLHPLLQLLDEIKQIFTGMGFRIEDGPEVETDYHNFEALNIPAYHPSRDMQDTFYLPRNYVLRTHTSPVQIRTMEKQKPPVRMIAPGKCFRKDAPDATHSPIFHQVEGLCVDRGVSFADLKGVVLAFAKKLFGRDVRVRFRPSFFPFTEPSAEYDFSCIFCKGKGCRLCKGTGWLEISGAGMVNPKVFGFVDYDPQIYTGYAFGMGVERIAILRYQIPDIRIFYENDVRFLEQF
jgi:phenylalanyl-tRNA synthetase alpha chain